jgi:quercetin dioxygenase-like cupin family protein
LARVTSIVEPIDDSQLALDRLALAAGMNAVVGNADADALLYVAGGQGVLTLADDTRPLTPRSAALVLAGEEAAVAATDDTLDVVVVSVGPEVDRHAPLGARELVRSLDDASAQPATGARSFQILFGPDNGSTRATLFAGFIPPGRAPWHYHLYDEIVWVPEGPGRLHLGEDVEDLGPGAAFRLRPREVHIVENTGRDEMTIVGVFTPAGSPSAAYLTPDVAAEYRFAG